jgi:hypothetical protein
MVMQPSFVIEFASLLLVGPHAATVLAIAGAVMQRLLNTGVSATLVLMRIAAATLALQGAGFAHRLFAGATGQLPWPAEVLAIAAATLVYCVVAGLGEQVAEPLTQKQPLIASWWRDSRWGVPSHVVGV